MKTKLINTKDYILLIDEESETTEGYGLNLKSLEVDKTRSCYKALYKITNTKKVIAYYPLTKETDKLDLPLLPNPFEEFDELSIHLKYINELNDNKFPYFIEDQNNTFEAGWKMGYKAAQSKKYSEEDMKKAFIHGANIGSISNDSLEDFYEKEKKKFIQSLSTQQLPKDFILKYYTNGDLMEKNKGGVRTLFGTYKF